MGVIFACENENPKAVSGNEKEAGVALMPASRLLVLPYTV